MENYSHSLVPEAPDADAISIDEHDFVPHFQRVSISGEDTSGVPLEDLERASKLLIQSLELRERYMTMSQQSFPQTTGRFVRARQEKDANVVHHDDKKTIAGELFLHVFPQASFNIFKLASMKRKIILKQKPDRQGKQLLMSFHVGFLEFCYYLTVGVYSVLKHFCWLQHQINFIH